MIDLSSRQCRELTSELSRATRGEAFVLMGGDCAESFSEFKVSRAQEMALCIKKQKNKNCQIVEYSVGNEYAVVCCHHATLKALFELR